MPPAPILTGARLTLRPVGPGDVEAIAAFHADPRVTAMLVDAVPDTPEVARIFVAWNAPMIARGYGTFAVFRRDDPALAGLFSLVPYKEQEWLLELGGRLAPTAWSGGLGVEAAALLIDHAFGALDRAELVSAFDPANRSARVSLRRLGFHDDGEDDLFGRRVERMRLDRADWAGRPGARRRG